MPSFSESLFKKRLLVAYSVLTSIQVHLIVAFSSDLVHTYSNSFVFVNFLLFANTLKRSCFLSFFTRLTLDVKGPCACDIVAIILWANLCCFFLFFFLLFDDFEWVFRMFIFFEVNFVLWKLLIVGTDVFKKKLHQRYMTKKFFRKLADISVILKICLHIKSASSIIKPQFNHYHLVAMLVQFNHSHLVSMLVQFNHCHLVSMLVQFNHCHLVSIAGMSILL